MTEVTKLEDVEIYDIEEAKSKGQELSEGVYHIGKHNFAETVWDHLVINFADDILGTDWTDTRVHTSIALGGGGGGRDHWGWPYEGFASVMHGEVSNTGLFNYFLEAVGSSSVAGGVFRYIRRGRHGVTAKLWRMP